MLKYGSGWRILIKEQFLDRKKLTFSDNNRKYLNLTDISCFLCLIYLLAIK